MFLLPLSLFSPFRTLHKDSAIVSLLIIPPLFHPGEMVADIQHEIHVVGDHDKSFVSGRWNARLQDRNFISILPMWILPERFGSEEFDILPDCSFPGDHCGEGPDISDKSGFT